MRRLAALLLVAALATGCGELTPAERLQDTVGELRRLTAGPDHPVSLYCPEGEYLKGFALQIEN